MNDIVTFIAAFVILAAVARMLAELCVMAARKNDE